MDEDRSEDLLYASQRYHLLVRIKSTVDGLLASGSSNVWSTYGGLSRICDDIRNIFLHGLLPELQENYLIFVQSVATEDGGSLVSAEEDSADVSWIQQSLLKCCLSSHITLLTKNEKNLAQFYHDYAFLCSDCHVQALRICLKAVEEIKPQLLQTIDQVLLNKNLYLEWWFRKNTAASMESSTSVDSTSSAYTSPSEQASLTDESTTSDTQNYEHYTSHMYDIEEEGSDTSSQLNIEAITEDENYHDSNSLELLYDVPTLTEVKLVKPPQTKTINRVALAQAALTVAMGSKGETSQTTDEWFGPKDASAPHAGGQEPMRGRGYGFSAHERKKQIGHKRSKSDQIFNTTRTYVEKENLESTRVRTLSQTDLSQFANSNLSTSVEKDTVYKESPRPRTLEDESFMSYLSSRDCYDPYAELDKENAHFNIIEALISTIELMKCEEIEDSDDENYGNDAEIQELQIQLERRKLEIKQKKFLQEHQQAFSDGTTQSGESVTSTSHGSNSLSSGASEGASSEGLLQRSGSNATLTANPILECNDPSQGNIQINQTLNTEITASDHENPPDSSKFTEAGASPLSAEALAKSLLLKFQSRRLPVASDLKWLVSEKDVPQSLLPLPTALPVSPDDAEFQSRNQIHEEFEKRTQAPCRLRGNVEWAPPRPQIIFDIPPYDSRKAVMVRQNFRCAGCGMKVDQGYERRFRYCNYTGKYFCGSCHSNCSRVIPARIIRKWDFKKQYVSDFARDLLSKMYMEPLFYLSDLNPSLYSKYKILSLALEYRTKLHYLKSFITTCRLGQHLLPEYEKFPQYFFDELHLYSMHDLVQVKNGDSNASLGKLLKTSLAHVAQCQLCLAKGFICEFCREGDVLFPFELGSYEQCPDCRACFHHECYVKDKCPKCERLKIRQQLQRKLSDEDDTALT